MNDVMNLIREFSVPCPCGVRHETTIRDVRIGSGLRKQVGEILSENGFSEDLLLVADKNTLAAADGIEDSLKRCGFRVEKHIYPELRVAEMKHVTELEELIRGKDVSILSVGTGSVNDPCRLAAARQDKKLCIFGTAPSMDGFASYSSPLVDRGFKASYPAKSPEVVIGDTEVLAAAPKQLKSAGFGDMMAKYVGLIDWKLSNILTGEYYCDRVAALTRKAADDILSMADKVTAEDEETAGSIFSALLLTGIGMSFTKNSRPASGSEHIIGHLIECIELRDNKIPNFHGEDIGVCTLEMLRFYGELAEKDCVSAHREQVDWDDVYSFYGSMSEDVRKVNTPDTVTDLVSPRDIEEKWQQIRDVIRSVPDEKTVRAAMESAGCRLTVSDIGKSDELFSSCVRYSPYMRRRLTLLRMKDMIG